MSKETKQLIKVKIHPELRKYKEYYDTASDVIDGMPAAMLKEKYLPRDAVEDTAQAQKKGVYESRLKHSYPLPITDGILTQHVGTICQPMSISGFGEKEDEKEILNDADGEGYNYQSIFSETMKKFLAHGRVGVLVAANSESQPNQRNTYQVIYEASSILSWERFKEGSQRGKFKELLLQEEPTQIMVDGKWEQRETVRRFFFYDGETNHTQQILIADKKDQNVESEDAHFQLLREIPTKQPFIPFYLFGRGPEDSAIRAIVYMAAAVTNRLSYWGNINRHQGFQRTLIFGVKETANKVAEYLAAVFRDKGSAQTIEAGKFESVEAEIKFILHQINRLGLWQFNQLSDDTKQVQSAESKAKDLAVRQNIYDRILRDYFEPGFTQIYKYHAIIEGRKDIKKIEVSISRDFGLHDTEFELNQDTFIITILAPMLDEAGDFLVQQIAKKYVSEMRFVPSGEDTAEELKKRAFELIDAYKPRQRIETVLPPSNLISELADAESDENSDQ